MDRNLNRFRLRHVSIRVDTTDMYTEKPIIRAPAKDGEAIFWVGPVADTVTAQIKI